jgi:hypothetical protein
MISRLFCYFYQPKIGAYETDTLSLTERERFARHLSACAHCQQALSDYRTMGEQLRTLARYETPVTLSPDLWQKIDAQIQATPQLPTNSFVSKDSFGNRARMVRPALATASVLCLGVFAFANRAQLTAYLAPSAAPQVVAVADNAPIAPSPEPLPSPRMVAQAMVAQAPAEIAPEERVRKAEGLAEVILPSPTSDLTTINMAPLPPALLKTPQKAPGKAILETKKPLTDKDFHSISQEIMKKGSYDPFVPVEKREGAGNGMKIKHSPAMMAKPKAFPTTMPTTSPAPANTDNTLPLIAKGDNKVSITMDGVKMRREASKNNREASKNNELSELEKNGISILNRQNEAVRQSNMFSRGRSSVRVIPVSTPVSVPVSSPIEGEKAKENRENREDSEKSSEKVWEKISETGK